MTLGFFILSALDLLGVGADTFPTEERENFKDWVLKCQHPNGGFCGSPNHRFPDDYYAESGSKHTDPANLPATFFALLLLSFVGGFTQVKRMECLRWLKTLQREDGSFGELITPDGTIEGGRDMRHCYIATAIRWILRGDSKDNKAFDINVERLINHIRSGQTYEGGISESSEHEAHAGYTYCAIGALSLLDRLPSSREIQTAASLTDVPALICWLVSRQVEFLPSDNHDGHNDYSHPNLRHGKAEDNGDSDSPDQMCVGFNGRCNKLPDTCYGFWVSASLDMFGQVKLLNTEANRRFLIEKTQHRIGGFGKFPGNPPGVFPTFALSIPSTLFLLCMILIVVTDIYHSYLALATLATMKEPGIKQLDSALCISIQAKEHIKTLWNE
ncbi:hypothetical protein B7463_g9622, partial [Scytalidium lignicola]